MDELKVALAVADEGIKQLRGAWIQFSSIEVNNTALSILIRPVLQLATLDNIQQIGEKNSITQK